MRHSFRCLALILLGATGAVGAETRDFSESAADLGVDFTHRHFGSGEKYMPENMAPGVAIFDADGDGRLDLYLVQGAPLAGAPSLPDASNRLFQQRKDGTFSDVTEAAGVGDQGYGMGAAFGDYDGDGDLDLYVTNFGPNVLYRNRGDGTFENLTETAGVGHPAWSTSAGFVDFDRDGDLDLMVVNYVDFAFDNHKWCGNAQLKLRSYCHPDVYQGLADVLYRNLGDGRFVEVPLPGAETTQSLAKGLGVLFADFDENGFEDLYVANDSTRNFLYLSDSSGGLRESGLLAGVAVNGAGQAEASMGVEIGDVDGDGRLDFFLTHLDEETNTLYRGLGDGLFLDGTDAAGLARPSLPWVSFGTVMLDHDHDGDLDLFVTNGHIVDNIAEFDSARSHRQPSQLFENLGNGRFREISEALGLEEHLVGRGAAAGDLDRDGDLDLVIAQNGGRALVLRNRVVSQRRSLLVRLRGKSSNPQGFGAVLELSARLDGSLRGPLSRQVRLLKSVSSYLSQGAPEVHFGLGSARQAEQLIVRWPSGAVDRHGPLAAGSLYLLTEGVEAVGTVPFSSPSLR